MAQSENDIYGLGRDGSESTRLDEQHLRLVTNAGYIVHPTIQATLPPNPWIADVGAGTGAWALHAASLYPESTTVAFDISSAQFPPPGQRPSNVQFVVADAKQSFAESEHCGSFDLVNVRALVTAMQQSDWDVFVQNCVQLLKPGGAFQWTEGELNRVRCLRSSAFTQDSRPYTALPKVVKAFQSGLIERLPHSFDELPKAAAAHLERVEEHYISSDRLPELRTTSTRVLVGSMFSFAEKAKVWLPQDLSKLRQEVDEEIASGAYLRADLLTVIGFKRGQS